MDRNSQDTKVSISKLVKTLNSKQFILSLIQTKRVKIIYKGEVTQRDLCKTEQISRQLAQPRPGMPAPVNKGYAYFISEVSTRHKIRQGETQKHFLCVSLGALHTFSLWIKILPEKLINNTLSQSTNPTPFVEPEGGHTSPPPITTLSQMNLTHVLQVSIQSRSSESPLTFTPCNRTSARLSHPPWYDYLINAC